MLLVTLGGERDSPLVIIVQGTRMDGWRRRMDYPRRWDECFFTWAVVDESRALTISTVRKKGSGRNVLLPDANDEDDESAKKCRCGFIERRGEHGSARAQWSLRDNTDRPNVFFSRTIAPRKNAFKQRFNQPRFGNVKTTFVVIAPTAFPPLERIIYI